MVRSLARPGLAVRREARGVRVAEFSLEVRLVGWCGGYAEWVEGETAFLSVVFSWSLPHAFQRAIWLRASGLEVKAGGPAVEYNRDFLAPVADVGGTAEDAVARHNPEATFTARGCPRKCDFCIVPKVYGDLIPLRDWPLRRIICDDNFLASPLDHFQSVIDRLLPLKKVDFNQGLDARILTEDQANALAGLDLECVRLAWDITGMETQWRRAFGFLRGAGIPAQKIKSYVLIGHTDTPADALYRLETIKGLGAWPIPMRYQPLGAPHRNSYVGPHWTEGALAHFTRYWFRQRWLGRSLSFQDYCWGGRKWDPRAQAVVPA